MKIGILAACVCLVLTACAAYGATGTIDLYAGYNLFALPNVPIDPVPADMFGSIPLDGNLSGLDATTGSGFSYSDFEPGAFGNLLLGDGFWLYVDSGATITYASLADGVPGTDGLRTDMWISLPGVTGGNGGWHIIGNPYAVDVPKENISFTDGTTVLSWDAASQDPYNWVDRGMTGLDPVTQSGTSVSLDFGTQDVLSAGSAYYLMTYKANIAMIVTAP